MNTLKVVRADNPADAVSCSTTFTGGSAGARHTYGGLTYIASADRMFVFGGVPWCPGGGSESDTWTLDLSNVGNGAAMGWQRMDPTGGGHPCDDDHNSEAAYDPNTQLVFVNDTCGGSGLWSYNFSANSYTQLNSAAANLGLHTTIVIDLEPEVAVAVRRWIGVEDQHRERKQLCGAEFDGERLLRNYERKFAGVGV